MFLVLSDLGVLCETAFKPVTHLGLKGLSILYQNSTKSVPKSVGSFFRGGEHGKCQICTLNREKCTDLVLFWSHTQIHEKTISSVIMMRMVLIWYNFKMCTNL